ncbi:alpha/beta hydrolase [Aquimarina sp. AD10]|uniref:BD-FAE-like domain-containing protein n=1 Tax=Aquimarina aggregata TaxID=1642818 RepID=A0A162WSI4_9FLAO|nr:MULTISPECIES: alpha/beta hydrolase [Aquimarina]AXT60674.1 alpha/beta hydrolase [Aquimarina sp. AD10]KZS38271.1 hypothetical protein AWE51_17045 [Aquimarina aggregata]RKN01766.1 alpha/beta hydrolase [Aquimarina sp. AD10]
MRFIYSLFFLIISTLCFAQEKEYNSAIVKINRYVEGSLVTPYTDEEEVPLIILIMDAGAINRDGNDRMSKNDTFKKLSYDLAKQGIATYRYDKRLFKMEGLGIREDEISFDHYITDVKSIIAYFKRNKTYTKIIVAGHGQGSLIGMLAAKDSTVNGFISIAGNAQSIDEVIIEQISKQAPGLDKSAIVAFRELRDNGRATNYEPALASIFRSELQPFMRSWVKYTPTDEISQLETPVLIIHGEKDIQVALSQAEKLKESAPQSEYVIVPNMNHILKEIKGDRLENHKSYNESWRKIMPEVITSIVNFVNK